MADSELQPTDARWRLRPHWEGAGLQLRRFARLTVSYAGGAIVVKAGLFAVSLWLARELTVHDYGRWGVAFSLQAGFVAFALVGLIEAATAIVPKRRISADRQGAMKTIRASFLVLAGATALVASALAGPLIAGGSMTLTLWAAAMVSGLGLAIATLQGQLFNLTEEHRRAIMALFGTPATGLFGSFLGSWYWRTPEAYFIGFAGGALSMLATQWLLVPSTRPSLHFSGSGRILVRAVPFLGVACFGWLSGYGFNSVVGLLFGSAQVAHLTLALSLGGLLLLLGTGMNQVWSPRFHALLHEAHPNRVESLNGRFYALQGWVLGGVGFAVLGSWPHVTRIVGGNLATYSHLDAELLLIVLGYLMAPPFWHCQNYFYGNDAGRAYARMIVLSGSIGLSVWVGLAWWLGPIGIYAGFLAQMANRSLWAAAVARSAWGTLPRLHGVLGGSALAICGYVWGLA